MSLGLLLRAPAFYGAVAIFGVWAFGFNVVSFLFSWLPASGATESFFQRLIQRQVAAYLWFLRGVGVVRVEYRGWERMEHGPAVIVANHPGLLDAFYLIARVPRAFCIFKPAVGRNPVLAAAARRAGYLPNDSGVELLRGATERIGRGASLVVFPEGTRTPASGVVEPLRPGFAAIARRASVPVQCVRITTDRRLLGKGDACWRLPELPVRVVVEAGPRLDAAATETTKALVREVEAWFRGGPVCAELTRTTERRTFSVA